MVVVLISLRWYFEVVSCAGQSTLYTVELGTAAAGHCRMCDWLCFRLQGLQHAVLGVHFLM
jgi:hypothetical protein